MARTAKRLVGARGRVYSLHINQGHLRFITNISSSVSCIRGIRKLAILYLELSIITRIYYADDKAQMPIRRPDGCRAHH